MESLDWQTFLDKLTKVSLLDGVVQSFKLLPNDEDRLKFCLNHKLISTKLCDWLARNAFPDGSQLKDAKVALKFKTEGNSYYVRKKEDRALDCYNKGLLHATKSELGVLYGNRSAVLFSKSCWNECIRDIEAACMNDFPLSKQWKLYKRKGEAFTKLLNVSSAIDCFRKVVELLKDNNEYLEEQSNVKKLIESLNNEDKKVENGVFGEKQKGVENSQFIPVSGYNDAIPNVSKSVALCNNTEEGRHLIARDNLEKGSIIMSENPYAAVLLPPWYSSRCQHCFCKVTILFPCHVCTKVCYCSPKCQEESWNSYHWFECGKLSLMEKIGIAHLAMRIILVTEMSTLLCFIDVKKKTDVIPGCNQDGIYNASYESVYNLLPHSQNIQVEDRFQYTLAGVLIYKVLEESVFFQNEVSSDVKYHVGGLIIRHIQQLVCNAHAITSLHSKMASASSNLLEQDQVRIATAIYPTTSLLNHSCEPSIVNSFHKDRLIVKLAKNVKAGDQIYNCYGPHYRRMNFADRQQTLKQQYFFTCKCQHCLLGAVAMEEMDCFRCGVCNQRLSVQDGDMCSHCGTQISGYYEQCRKKTIEAERLLASGLDVLQEKQNTSISKAIKLLLKSLKIQEEIYFKYHSSLAKTFDVIAKCYTMLQKYAESLIYLKRSVAITESRYGKDSIEVANELLKLSDVYMALIQQHVDAKDLISIRNLLPEALATVNKSIAVVELTKEPDSEDLKELKVNQQSLKQLQYLS